MCFKSKGKKQEQANAVINEQNALVKSEKDEDFDKLLQAFREGKYKIIDSSPFRTAKERNNEYALAYASRSAKSAFKWFELCNPKPNSCSDLDIERLHVKFMKSLCKADKATQERFVSLVLPDIDYKAKGYESEEQAAKGIMEEYSVLKNKTSANEEHISPFISARYYIAIAYSTEVSECPEALKTQYQRFFNYMCYTYKDGYSYVAEPNAETRERNLVYANRMYMSQSERDREARLIASMEAEKRAEKAQDAQREFEKNQKKILQTQKCAICVSRGKCRWAGILDSCNSFLPN